MKLSEITNLNERDLKDLINTDLNKLRELRFRTANSQLKNVREIRELKKNIARAKTILRARFLK